MGMVSLKRWMWRWSHGDPRCYHSGCVKWRFPLAAVSTAVTEQWSGEVSSGTVPGFSRSESCLMLLGFGVEGFAILHCFQEWLGVSVHSLYSAQLQIGGVEEKKEPVSCPRSPFCRTDLWTVHCISSSLKGRECYAWKYFCGPSEAML